MTSVKAGYLLKALTGKSKKDNQARLSYSTAMGQGNTAIGQASTAMGQLGNASGAISTTMGDRNQATGSVSTAMGFQNMASGDNSTVMGTNNTAQSFSSLVIGQFNQVAGNSTTWVSTDPLFVVGNGTNIASPNNALTLLKDGNMTIAGTLTSSSDKTLKTNIQDLANPLDKVVDLRGVTYQWNPDTNNGSVDSESTQVGFIAQEVQKVLPDLVTTQSNGKLAVNYIGVVPVMAEAIQVLKEGDDAIKADLKTLQTDNQTQTKDINSLQSDINTVQTDNATQSTDINSLQTANQALKTDITKLQAENESLRSDLEALQKTVEVLQKAINVA
jgi:hypothetical protein